MAENLIAEDIVVVDERDTRSSSFLFLFLKATTFDYSTLNSTSVHCLWSHKFHFFIKYWSFDTIYTFKNYFATVFSVFSKNKLYLSRNLFLSFFLIYLDRQVKKKDARDIYIYMFGFGNPISTVVG